MNMMMVPLRVYMTAFTLCTVAYVIFSLSLSNPTNLPTSTDPIIDESMYGVQAHCFNQAGNITQTVTIRSWRHHKGKDVAYLESPVLKIHHKDGSSWEISSQKGQGFHKAHRKLDKLLLSDEVTIQRFGPAVDSWELKTDLLWFIPTLSTAFTQALVTVVSPEVKMQALGMRADLKHHSIKFLNHVNTSYAKPTI